MYNIQGLLKKYFKFIIGLIIIGIIQNLLIIIYPLLIRDLLKNINNFTGFWNIKYHIIIGLIGIMLINICEFIYNYVNNKFYEKFIIEECIVSYDNAMDIDYEILKKNKGKYYSQGIYNHINGIGEFIINNVIPQIILWINIIVILILVMNTSSLIVVIDIALTMINYFMFKRLNYELESNEENLKVRQDELLNDIDNILNSVDTIKLNNNQQYFYEKLYNEISNVQENRTFFQGYRDDNYMMINFINQLSFFIIMVLCSTLLIMDKMIINNWIFILVLQFIVLKNMNILKNISSSLEMFKVKLKFINDEILKNREFQGIDKLSIDNIKNIECNIKNFKGQNEDVILENFNVTFYQGEKIAIIGDDHSGKSIIWKLIVKLYKSEGIFINGFKINIINNKSIRKLIWIVSENNEVISGTVLENIFLNNEITSEKINYIKGLSFVEILKTLSNGLDTYVCENNLSRQQLEVIKVCRLLIGNPEVIILDEPTKYIGEQYEDAIYNEIYKVFEKKMIILITDKISILDKSEVIFRVKDGEVVNQFSSVEELKTRYTM